MRSLQADVEGTELLGSATIQDELNSSDQSTTLPPISPIAPTPIPFVGNASPCATS